MMLRPSAGQLKLIMKAPIPVLGAMKRDFQYARDDMKVVPGAMKPQSQYVGTT
jgi:hypothetical protein